MGRLWLRVVCRRCRSLVRISTESVSRCNGVDTNPRDSTELVAWGSKKVVGRVGFGVDCSFDIGVWVVFGHHAMSLVETLKRQK
jgi:hypothetical protein